MKTIEVSDEAYDFLCQAQRLLKEQDNRCTADPLYCVMQKERIYGLDTDYSSDYEWYNSSYSDSCSSNEELFNELIEDDDVLSEIIEIYNEDSDEALTLKDSKSTDLLKSWFLEEVDGGWNNLLDYLEDKDYKKVYYIEKHSLSQSSSIFSFFEQDAIDFVRSKNGQIDLAVDKLPEGKKKSDYDRMYSYAESSWRASRMNKLRKIIKELKLHE